MNLTIPERLDDLDRRVNHLFGEMRDLRRRGPVRWVWLVYLVCACATVGVGNKALHEGSIWGVLGCLWVFAVFCKLGLAAKQDQDDHRSYK